MRVRCTRYPYVQLREAWQRSWRFAGTSCSCCLCGPASYNVEPVLRFGGRGSGRAWGKGREEAAARWHRVRMHTRGLKGQRVRRSKGSGREASKTKVRWYEREGERDCYKGWAARFTIRHWEHIQLHRSPWFILMS